MPCGITVRLAGVGAGHHEAAARSPAATIGPHTCLVGRLVQAGHYGSVMEKFLDREQVVCHPEPRPVRFSIAEGFEYCAVFGQGRVLGPFLTDRTPQPAAYGLTCQRLDEGGQNRVA